MLNGIGQEIAKYLCLYFLHLIPQMRMRISYLNQFHLLNWCILQGLLNMNGGNFVSGNFVSGNLVSEICSLGIFVSGIFVSRFFVFGIDFI